MQLSCTDLENQGFMKEVEVLGLKLETNWWDLTQVEIHNKVILFP